MTRKIKLETVRSARGRPRRALDLTDERGRIGERIRAARERAKLSVEDAAARAGMHRDTWYALERGEVPDWFSRLGRLLAALGCELGDLIPEDEVDDNQT